MDEICPICKTAMETWQIVEHEDHIDTLLKCSSCGFVATFWKVRTSKERD